MRFKLKARNLKHEISYAELRFDTGIKQVGLGYCVTD